MKTSLSIPFATALLLLLLASLPGCSPRISLFPDHYSEFGETTLQGTTDQKILLATVNGTIDTRPKRGLLSSTPSMLEELTAVLQKARRDPDIKALLLSIDSGGGTATASDILYREIQRYKQDTGVPVVALIMDVAASGGYYIAVAADHIMAHPTSITGSIGVVFQTIEFEGLSQKIGVRAHTIKSGSFKDMGSYFRNMSEQERAIFQSMIDELYDRFISVVADEREELTKEQVRELADGRIYTAGQALQLKLIDSIGYANDAIAKAKELANLPDNARVVVYRHNYVSNDNFYRSTTQSPAPRSLMELGVGADMSVLSPRTGFYYLWQPGLK